METKMVTMAIESRNTLSSLARIIDELVVVGFDRYKQINMTYDKEGGVCFEQEVVIEHGFRLTFHGDASFSIGCKCESATIYNVGPEPTIDEINKAWNQHPHKELSND